MCDEQAIDLLIGQVGGGQCRQRVELCRSSSPGPLVHNPSKMAPSRRLPRSRKAIAPAVRGGWRAPPPVAGRAETTRTCQFGMPGCTAEDAAGRWIERQHAHATAGTAMVLAIIAAGEPGAVGMIGLLDKTGLKRVAALRLFAVRPDRGRGSGQGRR